MNLGINLSVDLNVNFDTNHFPNLMMLFVNGNNLLKFPDLSLQKNLFWLGIARCNLNSLPPYLNGFKKLTYLDARDNNISRVDSELKTLIQKNSMESYFSGNPLCMEDSSLDCKPLCSKNCWSRHVSKNQFCDETCNSKECHYDGGDCNRF